MFRYLSGVDPGAPPVRLGSSAENRLPCFLLMFRRRPAGGFRPKLSTLSRLNEECRPRGELRRTSCDAVFLDVWGTMKVLLVGGPADGHVLPLSEEALEKGRIHVSARRR